ncbi:MAG: regulatory iron-sulfur-containing complex subunit RicT [Planctomycetaceae bacterium]
MASNYVIRYSAMRHLGEFHSRDDLTRGAKVVVHSKRGTEFGEVLCVATAKTREYLQKRDPGGKVLRIATPEDERTQAEHWQSEQSIFKEGKQIIADSGLSMQVIDVEKILGGERIVFYYVAEARVDFRELVKVLAKAFNTRIEMRQIGVRDEAKLLADYGDCGKPVCCNTHLQEMPPVSMKMVKAQKATLDPNKISGRCGRLKCCLRYEYETYEAYRKELPKVGKFVVTKQGQGKVLAQEILAQKVIVAMEDKRRLLVDAADIITVLSGRPDHESGQSEKGNHPPKSGKKPEKKAD